MLDQVIADLELSTIEADHLRNSLLNDEFVEQFLLGPSFSRIHRHYMTQKLYDSPSILGHAYVASAMSWGDDSDVISPGPASANGHSEYFEKMYHHATEALSVLRSFQPSNAQEMCIGLALGVTILTFTLKLRVADARAVCRQTLEIAKPVYVTENLLSEISPDDASLISCLILTDVAESLIFCDPPTLRYRHSPDHYSFDRYVGLSCSFLPLLYDVAELSFQIKTESEKAGSHSAALAQFEQTLRGLEDKTRLWMPDGPAGCASSKVNATELSHVLCQSEAHRNAARLVLHRLKYSFGTEDRTAEAISSHILTSLRVTTLVTGSVPRCIDFPLIVACLELDTTDERAEYLSTLSPISNYSSAFHERTRAICNAVCEARQTGRQLYWCNLATFISNPANGS